MRGISWQPEDPLAFQEGLRFMQLVCSLVPLRGDFITEIEIRETCCTLEKMHINMWLKFPYEDTNWVAVGAGIFEKTLL